MWENRAEAMLPVAVRGLLVYGGTAAILLFLAHRLVEPLRLRVAILIACAPSLIVGKALLTGGVCAPLDIAYLDDPVASHRREAGVVGVRTPLLSDVVFSYLPGLKAVRESVKNGRPPLWNRFQAAGEPLLAFQQPAVFHPGTWIGFLLPLAQAWTFGIAFRLLIALISAYLFFRDLRCGELASGLGAAGWAFCDHMSFYLGFSVGAAAAPFPLLLLGLRRLISDGDRRAVGVSVAALTLIATAGHPETLLHCVAGGGVYFLFELAFAPGKRRIRPLLLALAAGGLTLGLTAVVILPLREILPYTQQGVMRSSWYAKQKKSTSLRLSGYRSLRNLMPLGVGLSEGAPGEGPLYGPAAYSGSLLFPLAALGLSSNRREKWAFLLMTILGLSLWARLVGITDLVSKLPLFDVAVNDYLVFVGAFGMVALAVLGAQLLSEGRRSVFFVVAALVSAAVLSLSYSALRPHFAIVVQLTNQASRTLWLLIAPLIAAGGAALLLRRRPALAVGALLVLLLAQRRLEAGEIYPTFPPRAFYPALAVLDAVPRRAPDRFVAVGYLFVPNVSSMYELEDVRAYEAMTLGALSETYPLWCVPLPVWYNRVDDLTRPFLSFLNVRYALSPIEAQPPPAWKVLREGDRVRLLENSRALPRAFAPLFLRFEPQPARQLEILATIDDFGSKGVVGSNGPSAWIKNGDAAVRVVAYTGHELSLRVDAREDAFVATSIPAWPGWRLTIDGKKGSLFPYNRAFLAFRVPAGSHAARLLYLPDGFLYGAAISLVTVALVGVLVSRKSPSRSRLPASER